MSKDDFSRQSFLGPNSESALRDARVAIVGLGGGGSHIAQQLAHLGVGNFRLMDPQKIESSNLNRLIGATQADIPNATPKVKILERLIHAIRPWALVTTSENKWQDVSELVRDAHVLFGCVDGYRQREYLESAARRFCIPYIDIGMDITKLTNGAYAIAGQMIMTRPGGPCMRCLGFLTSERLSQEENKYGDAGINPQVVWTNGTLASLAIGMFVKLIAPWCPFEESYVWLELEGNKQLVTSSQQPRHNLTGAPCSHYNTDGIGDQFFDLTKLRVGLKQ